MTDLVQFLKARFDELEAYADGSIQGAEAQGAHDEMGFWLLRDVESKRRMIDVADEATGLDMLVDGDRRVGRRDMSEEPYVGDTLLRLLALPFNSHPDYREEWRP